MVAILRMSPTNTFLSDFRALAATSGQDTGVLSQHGIASSCLRSCSSAAFAASELAISALLSVFAMNAGDGIFHVELLSLQR